MDAPNTQSNDILGSRMRHDNAADDGGRDGWKEEKEERQADRRRTLRRRRRQRGRLRWLNLAFEGDSEVELKIFIR